MLAQSKLCIEVTVDWQGRPQQDGPLSAEVKLQTRHLQPLHDEVQKSLAQAPWRRQQERSPKRPATGQGMSAVQGPSGSAYSPLQDAVDIQAHRQIVQELQSMGFPRDRAARAALATSNAGTQQAVDWLMGSDQPGSDGPSAHPLGSMDDGDISASGSLPQEPYFSASAAGVAGILRRQQQQAASTDRTMEQAFADLRGLMALAGDMVQLAERFREALAEQARLAGGTPEDHMDASMEADLISMGIASPVTKATSGALYHRELSRQLVDFLTPRINRAGGMMPLPDVYCLFNRARGTELISPDDLLTAVKLLPAIGAQLTFRQFASGVLVVQSHAHSDEQVRAQLLELTGSSGLGSSLTSSNVAAALHVPLAIASEHLLAAEGCGALCRDDGPEGLRFYRNVFADTALAC
ncbi:hypothetical protein CVIRNUC_003048 [Coccomyxa viridis]|uniref:Vacuolar protein-sorting-associated protein 36 n=1 Tax=Coccomyxa viridis TaxID=1274662 RepID=A0AAV1HYA3_9CHLO|nr:hypothetical protein CVIRNUC_003048 [Coccomyxa viridis]